MSKADKQEEQGTRDRDHRLDRKTVLQRLRRRVAAGSPIIGAGAGTGISAKFSERGGADFLVVYNSGRFRMAGRGSLAGMMPYGDANAIVVDMAREILPVVRDIPVLAGVCGTDPFRLMPAFLREVQTIGFHGVQNFPTVGLIDGLFRQNLEETGMGYSLEVDMIRRARELDLLTCAYVFDKASAERMTEAGADLIVTHLGLTTSGSIGAHTAVTLEQAPARVAVMRDAARAVRRDVLVLCHGGPLAEPDDAEYVLSRTPGIDGFLGASSIERLATERAIEKETRRFRELKLPARGAMGSKKPAVRKRASS